MAHLIGTWHLPPERDSDQHPLRVPGIRLRQVPGGTLVQLTRDTDAVSTTTWTVQHRRKCQLWGSPGVYLLDTADYCYMTFGVPGDPQLYAIKQDDWAALFATTDVLSLAWVDAHDALTPRPANSGGIGPPPPPPPIIIITSDNGGQDFPIGVGSNPYVLHAKFSEGTRVLSLWTTAFGGTNSLAAEPDDASIPEYPAAGGPSYAHGINWKFRNFKPYAVAGNHWPLPYPWYDTANWHTSDSHVDTSLPLFPTWWPLWHDPVFGITNDRNQFDPTQLWEAKPPAPDSQVRQGTNPSYGSPGTYPDPIEEEVLIRGNLPLAALPAGATVTSITFYAYFDLNAITDDIYLNDAFVTLPGTSQGQRIHEYGFPTPGDISGTVWNYGGDNLMTFKVRGVYRTSPAHHTASAYVDAAHTVHEAGGSTYRQPPTDWRTGGGGLFVPAPLTDPGPFFDMAVSHALLASPGANGRAYFYASWTLPDVVFSDATLWITAETGIGEIVVNSHTIATLDETINLWSAGTILRYTIPHSDLIRNSLNSLAVQAFSVDATCRLVFKLQVNP